MKKMVSGAVLCALISAMVFSGFLVPNVGMADKGIPDANAYDFPVGATLIPMGDQQADPREAYKFVFQRVYNSKEVQWIAEDIVYDDVTYPAGTFLTKASVSGSFTYVRTTTTLPVTKAYSLNKVKIALFSSTVKDSKGQAVTWEEIYFESLFKTYLWGNYFTSVNEAQIAAGTLSNYDILILPSVSKGYVDSVVAALGTDGLSNLATFVDEGGMIYAQGDTTYLAEAAGLVEVGTVQPDTKVMAYNNEATMDISGSSPLTYSLLSDKMYILQDPLFQSSSSDPVVAKFSSDLMDTSHIGSPAVLSYEIGSGRLILVSGHPSEKFDLLPLVLNAVLWGLSGKADLRNYIMQTYNPSLPWYIIPGREENIQMMVSGTLSNYWDKEIVNASIVDIVRSGFWVEEASIMPTPTSFVQDIDTIIVWTLDAPQGDFTYSYNVYTGPGGLEKGWKHVSGSWLSYPDPDNGRKTELVRDGLWIKSAMPAYLLGDRDIELDGVYPLPAKGWYFDMAFPLENKEETDAVETVIIDIVPLQSPVVNVDNQMIVPNAINGTNFGTNDPVLVNNTIFFYDNPNYPLPDGVADSGVTFTVADADTTYVYGPTGPGMVLPAKKLTWTYGTIRAFDHKEPMIRYGIFSREEYQRTVSFESCPIPGSVILEGSGGSVYTALGGHPVPYHEYLQHGIIYIPEYPEPPRVDYKDIWTRDHTLELRTTFYDIVPFPPAEEHAVITSTFEMLVDGERVLDYPMDTEAELHVMVKSWNGYPPYDPVLYPYHMDMIRNETLIRQVVPKGLGYSIVYDRSEFSPNTEIADIVETNTSTIIYYRQDLNASEKEVIDVYSYMHNIDHDEGTMKINDGARFVYRQIAVGPSRYEVHDNHVAVAWGVQNEVEIANVVAPVDIGTYGDEVFHFLSIQDDTEPQELADPYIKSHGFGNISATTYVGGRIEDRLLYSNINPGEKTLIRVEIGNNLGYDLTNVDLVPQLPMGFIVERAIFEIPPIWYDFPFLDVTDILDAWKGVYYFNVTAGALVTRGEVYEIGLILEGDNVPADFIVPSAFVGIKDSFGVNAQMTYGVATNLQVQQTVPSFVEITDARIANLTEKENFEHWVALNDQAMIESTYSSLRQIGVDETPSGSNIRVDYQLPAYAQQIPWRDWTLDTHEPLYIISRAFMRVSTSGVNRATFAPKVTYEDHFSRTKSDWGNARNVRAHGPEIVANPMIEKISVGNLEREFLTASAPNTVLAKIYVANLGDDIAQNVAIRAVIPEGVLLVSSTPDYVWMDPTTGEVEWLLADISPRGQLPISLELYTIPPIPGGVTEFLTLMETMQSEFTHMYLQQQVLSDTIGPPALNALNLHDIQPPGAPVLNPINSPTSDPTTVVTGTSEPDASVFIYRNSDFAGMVIADATGEFEMMILLVEGDNTITATAKDVFGNGPSEESAPVFVFVDTIPPSAPLIDSLPAILPVADTDITGQAEPLSTVEVLVNDNSVGTTPADSTGSFSLLVSLGEGDNVITARASDSLGNLGPYSTPLFVKVDTIPPTASIDYLSSKDSVEGRAIVFGGSGEDANRIIGYEWVSNIDGVLSTDSSFTTAGLSKEYHTITFRVRDEAGHWSNGVSRMVRVRTNTEPVIIAGYDMQVTVGEPVQFNGVLVESDGEIEEYEWDFDGDGLYDWSSDVSGTTSHTYDVTGTYEASFRVTDEDGDITVDSVIVRVEKATIGALDLTIPLSVVAGILAFFCVVLFFLLLRRKKEDETEWEMEEG
jgi:hypothetical protein